MFVVGDTLEGLKEACSSWTALGLSRPSKRTCGPKSKHFEVADKVARLGCTERAEALDTKERSTKAFNFRCDTPLSQGSSPHDERLGTHTLRVLVDQATAGADSSAPLLENPYARTCLLSLGSRFVA